MRIGDREIVLIPPEASWFGRLNTGVNVGLLAGVPLYLAASLYLERFLPPLVMPGIVLWMPLFCAGFAAGICLSARPAPGPDLQHLLEENRHLLEVLELSAERLQAISEGAAEAGAPGLQKDAGDWANEAMAWVQTVHEIRAAEAAVQKAAEPDQ